MNSAINLAHHHRPTLEELHKGLAEAPQPLRFRWEDIGMPPPDEPAGWGWKEVAYLVISIAIPIIGLIRLAGWALGWIARKMVLPATLIDSAAVAAVEDQFQQLVDRMGPGPLVPLFTAYRDRVITPDGAELSVKMIIPADGPASKTLLCFNGNAALGGSGLGSWALSLEGYNVVFFDYRGVGRSKGIFSSARDLIVDGASVAAAIQTRLGTRPQDISFYGESLGGAVALGTQASSHHFTGPHLNCRSFSSLRKVVEHIRLPIRIPQFLQNFAGWIIEKEGLDFDSVGALATLKQRRCPLKIAYERLDQVIDLEASLATSSEQAGIDVEDRYSIEERDPYEVLKHDPPDYHNLPFHREVVEHFIAFLSPPPSGDSA